MLILGNPMGAYFVAAGALSFGKGDGFLIAKQVLGFAAMAAALGGAGGGGEAGYGFSFSGGLSSTSSGVFVGSPDTGLRLASSFVLRAPEGVKEDDFDLFPMPLVMGAVRSGATKFLGFLKNLIGHKREQLVIERFFGNRLEVIRRFPIPGGEIDIVDPVGKVAAEVGGFHKGRALEEFTTQLDKLVTFATERGYTPKVFLQEGTSPRAIEEAISKVGPQNVVTFKP